MKEEKRYASLDVKLVERSWKPSKYMREPIKLGLVRVSLGRKGLTISAPAFLDMLAALREGVGKKTVDVSPTFATTATVMKEIQEGWLMICQTPLSSGKTFRLFIPPDQIGRLKDKAEKVCHTKEFRIHLLKSVYKMGQFAICAREVSEWTLVRKVRWMENV